jgi:diacylglycerol kinase (ATP)
MDKKLLLVINPVSGTVQDKTDTVALIRQMLENQHLQLKVWETTGEDDQAKIRQLMQKDRFDAVLIGGGDGTVKMVVEAVLDSDHAVGIIPLGSANGLATNLEVASLDQAIEAIIDEEEVKMDAIKINGELSLHLSDFGFNASLIKKFEDGGERGMLSYFKSSVAQLFDVQPYRFEVEIEQKVEQVEAKMLVIANGNKYGTGALINPVGKINDGLFEIIALDPKGIEDLVKISIALFRGNLNEMESVRTWQASKVKIRNLDGADFQIDGELLGKVEAVTVEVLDKPIRFFTGKNYAMSQL